MSMVAHLLAVTLVVSIGYPGKAPWRDALDVFVDGEPVPGLPYPRYRYGFQIPVLVNTPSGAMLAFAQAYVIERKPAAVGDAGADADGYTYSRLGASSGDGNDGWIDIVSKHSGGGGQAFPKDLTVVFRNSSLDLREYHACQQPTPVVDREARKIFLLSSLDNWHMRLQESLDDGRTWTASAHARDLDSWLRRPGWGLIFTGLPGGIQLRAPSPRAGRLVVCSSAYWTGGEMVDGRIVKVGDVLSRYSYTIISDDHGASWRIGSGKIQPRHTTECSVAQRYDGDGAVFVYARIWDKNCIGCSAYGRGIAVSLDGGETFDNATLRGLPDSAPDVEGSMTSDLVTIPANETGDGKPFNSTCFYVSAPDSTRRKNLTMISSVGQSGVDQSGVGLRSVDLSSVGQCWSK